MGDRKCHIIPFVTKMKIGNWLVANKERLLEKKPMFTSLARDVEEMFDVKIDSRVLGDLLESLEMKWEPKKIGRSNAGGGAKFIAITERLNAQSHALDLFNQRMDNLASRIEQQEAIIQHIIARLDKLLLDLGTERLKIVR